MNRRQYIMLFLFVFSVAGICGKFSSGNIKMKSKWKVRKSLDGLEISTVQTFVPKHRKRNTNVENILKNKRTLSKRSVEISIAPNNITEHMAANNSLKETSQADRKNYENKLPFEDYDMKKSLLWQLNLNVSSKENQDAPNSNSLDIADNPDVQNGKDHLDLSVYVSGKGPNLYSAWSAVEDFIKSLFGNDQNSISKNRVVLDTEGGNLNETLTNDANETFKILPTNSPGVFKSTTESLKSKEAKFLQFLGLGRQTTPPTILTTSKSSMHNLEESVSTKQTLDKISLDSTTESQMSSNIITTTDHSVPELVIEDVVNKNMTLQALPHVSESSVGKEHSFTVTVKSAIPDEQKYTVTEHLSQSTTEHGEGTKQECLDCKPEAVVARGETDFEEIDVQQVSTVHITTDISKSQQSEFTDAELEKYCMALVNRLGKALKMSHSLSEFSGDSEVNEKNTEISVFSNPVSNQTSEPTGSQNFGFFANFINSVIGRFRREDRKDLAPSNDIVSEPGISVKDQSASFGLSFRNSRADDLDSQVNSAIDETILSSNEDSKNLPSIIDCENFFRNNENTKMFPKPNLMDAINDPHIQLEDFEKATISVRLKEQQMQFLTDLLMTGMNQTVSDISTDETPDPFLLKDSTAFTEESENKEITREQFNAFSTEIESKVLSVTVVPEKNFFEEKVRQDGFFPTSKESIGNDEEIIESEISGKFINRFFGSGDRSLDATTPQGRFSIFGFGSGNGRIDTGEDQNELVKLEAENLLRKFENQLPEDSESTTQLEINLGNDISFEDRILDEGLSLNIPQENMFEGSGMARDFFTTEYLPLNKECDGCSSNNTNATFDVLCKDCGDKFKATNIPDCDDCADTFGVTNMKNLDYDCENDCDDEVKNVSSNVDCKVGCDSEFKLNETAVIGCDGECADVTVISLDCEDDCGDESENVSENREDSLNVPISKIESVNEIFRNESESYESISQIFEHRKANTSSLELDRTVSTDFPTENEPSTTEKKSRSFGTLFLTGSGAGGLLDNGGQINLTEEEERISIPSVPRRGARLEDSKFVKGNSSKFETSEDTPNAFTSYTLTNIYTEVSKGNSEVPPRRRGRLDDVNENPNEKLPKIGKVTENDQYITVSSQPDIDFKKPSTLVVTDNFLESSSVSSTLKSIVPRPTQPYYKPCTSASECSQALNERCVFLNSSSACTCGRSFVRQRETGICEAKVELKTALKLPREDFHEDLRNPNSEYYKMMKQRSEEAMWLLLSSDELKDNVADIQVDGFSEGSVVINYKVILAAGENESVSDMVDLVNSELTEAFQNESLLKSIPLDVKEASLIDISKAINPCSSSELNYCSQNAFCEQNETSVGGFYCHCKEGYDDLSKNKKYAGEICEETCLPNYCSEHGVCQMDEIVGRHCSCSGWYFGDRCQISGILIIVGISVSNIVIVIAIVVLLLCCQKRRRKSNSYGNRSRGNYPGNLELGSNLDIPSKIADVIALEDNVGIKTARFSAISTPVKPQLPIIKIINASINNSSTSFDSTFDKTPSPLYENYQRDPEVASTL